LKTEVKLKKLPKMRLLIHKVLAIVVLCTAVSTAQGQRRQINESCKEKVTQEIKTEFSLAVTEALESLKSLESLKELAVLESMESLAQLENLRSLELLVDFQGPVVAEADPGTDGTQSSYAHVKTKKVERAFKVSRSDKLNIENQFGKVEVQTWGRNEIQVEVNIIARAATEEKAQEIMDKINIRINEDRGGNLISFVTEREPMQIRSSSEKAFEINYVVKMPKGNPLQIANKYGSVQVPDFDGPTDLEVKYGQLSTGSLNNAKNNVTVSYSTGQCQMAYVKGGNLIFMYSNLLLDGADEIKTTTGYSKITIEKVNVLNMQSRYDSKFHIGGAEQIMGSGSYSAIKIGNLKESANLNMRYCSGFEITNMAPNFKRLELTGGYTGMAVGFADNTGFTFAVDTQYGSFKLNNDLANFSFKEVKNTSSSFKGNYGKAAPKGTVNVTSRYGTVAFR